MRNTGLLLDIDDLIGDSQIPQYPGWMDLCWFSLGGSGEFGQTRSGDIATITMPVSRISTKLQQAFLFKSHFRIATFVALDTIRKKEIFRATMKDLKVVDFQFRGYSGELPIHSLDLRFSKVYCVESKESLSLCAK